MHEVDVNRLPSAGSLCSCNLCAQYAAFLNISEDYHPGCKRAPNKVAVTPNHHSGCIGEDIGLCIPVGNSCSTNACSKIGSDRRINVEMVRDGQRLRELLVPCQYQCSGRKSSTPRYPCGDNWNEDVSYTCKEQNNAKQHVIRRMPRTLFHRSNVRANRFVHKRTKLLETRRLQRIDLSALFDSKVRAIRNGSSSHANLCLIHVRFLFVPARFAAGHFICNTKSPLLQLNSRCIALSGTIRDLTFSSKTRH